MSQAEEIRTTIAKMRQESWLRTALILLILIFIPSLFFATSFPFFLSDLIIPIGPPLTHVFHALFLFVLLFSVLIILSEGRDRRALWPPGKAPNVGPTVKKIVAELSAQMGVTAEVQPFGGLKGGEIESVLVGRRRVVRIGTNRLRESISEPQNFRFAVAHELTHLTSLDPRTNRIIGCAYITGAAFMAATFCSVLWEIGEGLVTMASLGREAVFGWLAVASAAFVPNAVSIGTLATLFSLERSAAMRLREFHADAIASALVGPQPDVIAKLKPTRGHRIRRVISGLFSAHPEANLRGGALTEVLVAFRSDRILFVLQGYFAAMIMEMLLEMLFANASASQSTLAQRKEFLYMSLHRFPLSITGIIVVAIFIITLSQFVALSRVSTLLKDTGAVGAIPQKLVQMHLLTMAGVFLALLSSETFYWEMSQCSWSVGRWLSVDPDRPALYATLMAGMMLAALLVVKSVGQPRIARLTGVFASMIPALSALIVGYAFYGR